MQTPFKLSIIYPVKSLQEDVMVLEVIEGYAKDFRIEHIIVSSEISDENYSLPPNARIDILPTQCRAERLNRGIALAKAQMLILHHPRSQLQSEGIAHFLENDVEGWGGFTHQFIENHPFYCFTSWYSNSLRADLRSIFYLDHCLFVEKRLLEKIGAIPEIDIFEDTELSLRLRKLWPSTRLKYLSKTSAVRFEKNGKLLQGLKNQWLKILYLLKVDHARMNRYYESKLNLNSRYTDE
ncbi:MAG: glycosyl transferase, family 2 [Halobacteriovoraceae bacterium]|nr:glycosyl transferase, family 2 [Halobacteriovoraceae bacterium]